MDKNEVFLLAFPVLQVAAFATAYQVLGSSYLVSGSLIVLAALFLSFSLHITFHYHVHFKRASKVANRVLDLVITALLGIPFHYYQMLHWNHHKYDNSIGDFTSTWKLAGGRPAPKNFFFYGLCWPISGELSTRRQLQIAEQERYLKPPHKVAMRQEVVLLVIVYGVLAYVDVALALAYLGMVYVGWCFIAMHNYGQHLPEVYGDTKANSYYNRLYNKLTLYNGLHYEHHHRPSVKYWDLGGPARSEIKRPHLVEGLFFSLKRRPPPHD